MSEMLMDGMPGIPVPYLLRTDGVITIILFLCLVLVTYIFSAGRKHLLGQFRVFASSRERTNLFDDVAVSDARYHLMLVFHTCVQIGVCLYGYFTISSSVVPSSVSHLFWLLLFIGVAVVYMIAKWVEYSLINWVFFSKAKNRIWLESYFNVMSWLGILLLPVVLLIVYFDLSPQKALYLILFVLFFAKMLLFYKCFSNFFGKFHGAIHLILYFCALEILPDLLMWKGIVIASNNLILNN